MFFFRNCPRMIGHSGQQLENWPCVGLDRRSVGHSFTTQMDRLVVLFGLLFTHVVHTQVALNVADDNWVVYWPSFFTRIGKRIFPTTVNYSQILQLTE